MSPIFDLEVSESLLIFAAQLGQDCIRQLTIFRGFHLLSDIERPCEELDLFAGFLFITKQGMGTLNIDIALMKRYAANKQRKELFALALKCHIMRTNATIWNFSEYFVRKNLHVGKAKAERLIEDAKFDPLFTFIGNDVRVGSLRDKTIKQGRRFKNYQGGLVKKFVFDINHDYTLKELYTLINETLVLFSISAKEEEDCLQQRGGLDNRFVPKSCDANSRTLTLRKLAQNLKMSISSTSRIMKDLANNNIINKQPSRQYAVISSDHVSQILDCIRDLGRQSFTFEHFGLTYIVVPCKYSIASRSVSDSFRHKIYGYHKGIAPVIEQSSTIPQLCGF